MDYMPEVVPISSLRLHQTEVLKKVAERPVILTQHGKAVAVMVDPEAWNRLIEELEILSDSVDALKFEVAMLKGEAETEPWEAVQAELNVPA